jgi:hypothetical protein
MSGIRSALARGRPGCPDEEGDDDCGGGEADRLRGRRSPELRQNTTSSISAASQVLYVGEQWAWAWLRSRRATYHGAIDHGAESTPPCDGPGSGAPGRIPVTREKPQMARGRRIGSPVDASPTWP